MSLLHEDDEFDATMVTLCERIADAIAAADAAAARETVTTQIQTGLAALIDEHARLTDRSADPTSATAQRRTG